ncbi:unnamed protein product, partial [Ectocarpus fasciculatus]
LEQYISSYSGYTRLRRLRAIATKFPQLRSDAIRLVIDLLKQGSNTSFYHKIYADFAAEAAAVEPMDSTWSAAADRAATTKLNALEQDLNAAKSMISKEGLRKAYTNLGDFYYERGNLDEALKCYCQCRNYCTRPWHVDEMDENVFNVSADMDEVITLGTGAVGQPVQEEGDSARPFPAERRQLTTALRALRQKDYITAARAFLGLQKFVASSFSTLISATDIAVYGTVLAVATLPREELRQCATAGHPFRRYLEVSSTTESLLNDFLECRYRTVMSLCTLIAEQFQCDIVFSMHLSALVSSITDRVFLQFVEPFESVDLQKMAEGLGMPIDSVIDRLAGLIEKGDVLARVDTVSKTLRRTRRDVREQTVKRVVKLTQDHAVNSQRALFRMCMLQNGVGDDNQSGDNM